MSGVPDWAESLAHKIGLRFPKSMYLDRDLSKVIADHLNLCSLTLTTAHEQITIHDNHDDDHDYIAIIGTMFGMLLMNSGANSLSVILAKAITTVGELDGEIDDALAEVAFRIVKQDEERRRVS